MEARLRIYLMIIWPMLTYASPSWQDVAPTHKMLLKQVQNRALRIIYGHLGDTRTLQMHDNLPIPYLSEIIDECCRLFWHRTSQPPYQILQNLGTTEPSRHIYRMPHPH